MSKDIIIAGLANLNMKKDLFFTTASITEALAIIVTQPGCQPISASIPPEDQSKPNTLDVTPSPIQTEESAVATEVVVQIPMIKPIYETDMKALLAGCMDCTALGVKPEDVKGALFESGDEKAKLFYFEANGYDYFFIDRDKGKGFEKLVWTETGNGDVFLATIAPEENPSDFDILFQWNPDVLDEQNMMLITYQPDGTLNSSIGFSASPTGENGKYLTRHARMAPREVEKPLPAELEGFAKELEATDYMLAWSEDKTSVVLVDKATGNTIPEFQIDPKTAEFTNAYKLPNIEKDFVVTGKLEEIAIDRESLVINDRKLVEGEWQRITAEFATKVEGVTVKLELTSVEEVQFEILNNNSSKPEDRLSNPKAGKELIDRLFLTEYKNGEPYYQFGGMYEPNYKIEIWGDNMILVPNQLGTELVPQDTALFVVVALGTDGRYGLVGWIDNDGEGQVRIVDKAGLNVPSNFNIWYATHKH